MLFMNYNTEMTALYFSFCMLYFIPLCKDTHTHISIQASFSKVSRSAPAGIAQWIECRLRTKGSLVGFPVRPHAWGVGQVPNWGCVRGNHTLMFLSPSFSLLPPLSKNK